MRPSTIEPLTDEELSTTLVAINRAFASFGMENVRVVIGEEATEEIDRPSGLWDFGFWDLEFNYNGNWNTQATFTPVTQVFGRNPPTATKFDVSIWTSSVGNYHHPPDADCVTLGYAKTLFEASLMVLDAMIKSRMDSIREAYGIDRLLIEERRESCAVLNES